MSTSDSIPPPTRDPVPTCLMATLKRRGAMKSKLSLFALAVLLLAAPARANQLWTWTGDCLTNNAGGMAVALCHTVTFQAITLDSYIPGTVFDAFGSPPPKPLVSASYHDDAGGSLTISQEFFDLNGFDLKFPASSGKAEGFIDTQTSFFRSFADGTWKFEAEGAAPDCTFGQPGNILCGYGASGINGTWTRVPGPSTFALVAVGLVGLVGLCRLTEEKSSRAWRRLRFRRSSATGT